MAELPTIKITNNCSVAVDIYNVFKAEGDKYFTYTKIDTLASKSEKTITGFQSLNSFTITHTGVIAGAGNTQQVDFPVAVVKFHRPKSGAGPNALTLQDSDLAAMAQTFNFIRYVSANPNSNLSTKFIAALGDTENPVQKVNDFFTRTENFKTCTYERWIAVTAWQTRLLSAWQGTFYLYDAMDKSSDPKDIKEIKLRAGVNIIVSNGKVNAELGMTDASGKWSNDSQKATLAMNHKDEDKGTWSITEENIGGAGLSIDLMPLWMNVTVKQDNQLRYLIAPALYGTINEQKVMGNLQELTFPEQEKKSGSILTDIGAWLEKNISIGLLVSAGMLFIMYKQWQEGKEAKESKVSNDPTKTEEEIKQELDKIERDAMADRAEINEQAQNTLEELKTLAEHEKADLTRTQTLEAQEAHDAAQERVDSIAEEGVDADLEAVQEGLDGAQDSIDAARPAEALSQLTESSVQLQRVIEDSAESFSERVQELSTEVQEHVREANDRAAELERVESERDLRDSQDVERTDIDSRDLDPIEMRDPIEFRGRL